MFFTFYSTHFVGIKVVVNSFDFDFSSVSDVEILPKQIHTCDVERSLSDYKQLLNWLMLIFFLYRKVSGSFPLKKCLFQNLFSFYALNVLF